VVDVMLNAGFARQALGLGIDRPDRGTVGPRRHPHVAAPRVRNLIQVRRQLAAQLFERYRYENCAVIALSDGGVLVGEQIAAQLHCVLTMLLVEDIEVPGESVSFGGVSQTGNFTYNSEFSSGEINEYTSEFHGYLDDQKRQAFQRINRLLGEGGLIDYDLLRDHTIILVNDGFSDTTVLDVAMEFLKRVRINRLVIAAPVASEQAVDRLHVMADELHILDVKVNYFDTDHYYTVNQIPTHEETVEKLNKIILNWR
jgi:predicted phosphoribosyltransferase